MEPFLGEIRLMGFGIVPKGWMACAGQTLPINTNQALFSLLGTTYGGDGRTTFALPDLRGRVTLGFGQGLGLQSYAPGQRAGTESVTLQAANMPVHAHPITGTLKATATPTGTDPNGSYPAKSTTNQYSTAGGNANLSGAMLTGNLDMNGGNQPHENRQPVMALNYCIALQGIFPSRG